MWVTFLHFLQCEQFILLETFSNSQVCFFVIEWTSTQPMDHSRQLNQWINQGVGCPLRTQYLFQFHIFSEENLATRMVPTSWSCPQVIILDHQYHEMLQTSDLWISNMKFPQYLLFVSTIITSNNCLFDCPITYTDIFSQCDIVH